MSEKERCSWLDLKSKLYVEYHDTQWGKPTYDDKILFEMLLLEWFQAGLSWLTILKKREAFRKSFDQFDVLKISHYNDSKVEELMNNNNIIRNRAKIIATINNATVFIAIQKEYGSFSNYIWGFTNNEIIKNSNDIFSTTTQLSDKISKDLKKRGMKFIGSTIIYSYLQAIGIINDHETKCFKYHD